MGIETLAVAALGAGLFGYGMHKQDKAERQANRQYQEQRNQYEQQQNQVRSEQARLNSQIGEQKNKIAQGQARANRRRIRGGLFGGEEAAVQGGPLSARLG